MKPIARSLVVVSVALLAVPALVVSVTITAAVQLLATTALIMGGAQHPLSLPTDSDSFVNAYFGQAVNNFIAPGLSVPAASVDTYAVTYPAEFFPVFGTTTFDSSVSQGRSNLGRCLGVSAGSCTYNQSAGVDTPNTAPPLPGGVDNKIIVFGYSQSAVVASLAKQDLVDQYSANPDSAPDVDFVLDSNPMRQNGGILGRGLQGLTIPIIGITFYGATPNCANGGGPCFDTVDVAQQYDLLGGDAPARLDPLAFANSLASYALLHGNVPTRTINGSDPQVILQDEYGDTKYYLITAPRLPLLMLFEQAGVPGPVLALPDALLRVWIEDKYRRDLSPGEHVQFQLSPIGNPVALVGNMLGAIPVGIDDTVAQATGDPDNRPLGTANVYRPFGVGGPVYDEDGNPAEDNVGIPTGAGDYSLTQTQTLRQPETGDKELALVPEETGNVIEEETPEGNETPEATKPEPFARLRESLKFDPDNRPFGIRPNGDGPLKRIVNAITGQRPNAAEPEAKKDESEPKAAA